MKISMKASAVSQWRLSAQNILTFCICGWSHLSRTGHERLLSSLEPRFAADSAEQALPFVIHLLARCVLTVGLEATWNQYCVRQFSNRRNTEAGKLIWASGSIHISAYYIAWKKISDSKDFPKILEL